MNLFFMFCIIIKLAYGQDGSLDLPKIDIIIVNEQGGERTFLEKLERSDVTLTELPVQTDDDEGFPVSPAFPVQKHSYQLRCTAPFPIFMDYEGEGTPRVHVSSHRILINATNEYFQEDGNNLFQIRLTFVPKESNSGKYICQGVEKSYAKNYVYLFIPGHKIFIADKPEHLGVLTHLQGENQVKFENVTTDQIFIGDYTPGSLVHIPCATSSTESVEVHLFEKITKGSKTVTNNITHLAIFDPKKGFLLKAEKLTDSRHFLCHGFDSRNGLKDTIAYSLLPLFQNGTINVKYSGTSDGFRNTFTCSVTPKHTPVYFGRMDCYSYTHCKFMERRLRKSFLPRKMQSDSGSFSLTYSTVSINLESDYISLRTDILHVSGMFYCSFGRNWLSTLVYNSFQHKIAHAPGTDFLEKPSSSHDILRIFRMETFTTSSDHNKEKTTPSTLGMICIGRSFFYIHGFVWKLEMEDRSVEFHSGDENVGSPSAYIRNKLVLRTSTSKKVKKITCYAPQWNSYGWDSSSVYTEDIQLLLPHHNTTTEEMDTSSNSACLMSLGKITMIIASFINAFLSYNIIH